MSTIVEAWRGYSLAERDRRWNLVRAPHTAQAGFDCIFVPLGNGVDARYLTQLKGAVQSSCIVLPTDGSEPVVITEYGNNDWVPDPTRSAVRTPSRWPRCCSPRRWSARFSTG